jgi:hypothetical protein
MSLFSTRAGGTGPAGGRPDMSQTMVSASSACSSDYTAGDSSCPCRDSVDFSNFLNSEGTALRPATNEHVLPTDYGLRGAQGELHSPGQAAPERRRYRGGTIAMVALGPHLFFGVPSESTHLSALPRA